MAVQQNKKSPSKRGMHRSHDALEAVQLSVEPSDCFVGQAGRLDAVGDKSIVAIISAQAVFIVAKKC